MQVHVYTLCWNEERMLPFFLAHYDSFAARIVVLDHHSTDGSAALIDAHPKCERRTFDTGGVIDDRATQHLRNTCWHESRGEADWVIVCDIDEMVHHPDIAGYLQACRADGVTVLHPHGFQMFSESFPEPGRPILQQVRTGVPSHLYSKKVAFDPNRIDDIRFGPGSHWARPRGDVRIGRDPDLKLLHYKFIGPLDDIESRWAMYGKRLSWKNRLQLLGTQYFSVGTARRQREQVARKAKPVV